MRLTPLTLALLASFLGGSFSFLSATAASPQKPRDSRPVEADTKRVDSLPHRGEWPQWGGPTRDNVSLESGWSVQGAELWRARVGMGYSSVSVAAGRLYTAGFDRDAQLDVVTCLDAETGEEVWSHSYPAKIWNRGHEGGTLTTPSVEGDVVYVLNREGIFHRFGAATGDVLEHRDLREELALEPPTWGFAASPLILDEAVVLNLGRVFAFEKATGELLWDTSYYGHAYSTPRDFTVDGRALLAVFNGKGLVLLDLETGDEVFHKGWKHKYDVNAATPVVAGNRVFVSSGMEMGGAMISVGAKGGELLWENKVMSSKMTGCVYYDGFLYGFDDTMFKCVNLQGHEMWRERGLGNGALSIADGKLIVVSADGELIVAPASPKGFEELSRTSVLEGGVYWTTPVLANGLIYVRSSLGDLVCRNHRQ